MCLLLPRVSGGTYRRVYNRVESGYVAAFTILFLASIIEGCAFDIARLPADQQESSGASDSAAQTLRLPSATTHSAIRP